MERRVFGERLERGAVAVRDFARTLVVEELPDVVRFRVRLAQSYDDNAGPEAQLFPEDAGRVLHCADAAAVVALLYRDGRVPQWVDLTVAGEDGATTIVEVSACGRFVEDDARLYYHWAPDQAPFGRKGPFLPVGWVEGQRFSIHHRSSGWSRVDLENTCRHGREVWSLELHGAVFDDVLSAGLPLPALEILELHGVSPGSFAGLAGLSGLRVLRLDLGGRPLDLGSLPSLPALSSLSLDGLPSRVDGVARLANAAPTLRELALTAPACPESDARLALPLEALTVRMPTLPAWVTASPSLRKLSLDASRATSDDVRAWLAACPHELEELWLRGPLVCDAILEDLRRFRGLQFLGVVGTAVTLEALERFAKGRRNLRHLPRRP